MRRRFDMSMEPGRLGVGTLLFAGLVALACSGTLGAKEDLDRLVRDYQQARAKAGQAGTKDWSRVVESRIAPILARIGKLTDPEAVKMLRREYSGSDPYLVAAAGMALIRSGSEEGIEAVTQGFNKGGGWKTFVRVRILDGLAASRLPAARDFLVKRATGGTEETKIIAIRSLARFPQNARACKAVLDGLKSSQALVRNAALKSLHKFRVKEMVPALIRRLGRERNDSVRDEVAALLVKRTGKNMGVVFEDWDKWWKEVGDRFEFPKADDASPSTGATVVTYFGIEVASKHCAFLVDASLSMLQPVSGAKKKGGKKGRDLKGAPGTKMAALKKELTKIIEKLPDDAAINIIFFNRGPIPWKSSLHPLRGSGRKAAISFVQALDCKLQTNIFDSLALALKDRRVDTIYLLSDGKPTAKSAPLNNPADILREIGARNRVRGAKINCISFGQETSFLKQLAKQNGGVYRATGGGGKGAGKKPRKGKGKGKGKKAGKAAK